MLVSLPASSNSAESAAAVSLSVASSRDWRNPAYGRNSQNEEISHIRPSSKG
jgi:hypothetical protein